MDEAFEDVKRSANASAWEAVEESVNAPWQYASDVVWEATIATADRAQYDEAGIDINLGGTNRHNSKRDSE
jgi:hypothetical protein